MVRCAVAGWLAAALTSVLVAPVAGLRFPYWLLNTPDVPSNGSLAARSLMRGDAAAEGDSGALEDMFAALATLQNNYFYHVQGTWPSAIDWTAAVAETILAGTLSTLSTALDGSSPKTAAADDWRRRENLVSALFAQVTLSFFGQDAAAIKKQAYDDMLWVVLGWTEAIELAQRHGQRYDPIQGGSDASRLPTALDQALRALPWHGSQWIDTFAARARDFWQLASKGWDTTLCAGGMIWNPRLEPYKNAITNELWVAASAALHQHLANVSAGPSKDSLYLAAAVEGYNWLKGSNMTNRQGLYVDGFHVDATKPNNVRCDVREMVYTYNQGVVLSGQRRLWAATGSLSFLAEGHRLVRSVVAATGWDLHRGAPMDRVPVWRGLGRGGILEEQCDASATCSQDAQAFKGIFFHHLTTFCAPLPPAARVSGVVLARTRADHAAGYRAYRAWVRHNAKAALATRDVEGRFGMWWGAATLDGAMPSAADDGIDHRVASRTDYRNHGTPQNALWGPHARWMPGAQVPAAKELGPDWSMLQHRLPAWDRWRDSDPNRRGRGRTVETQVGGLALMRASYEFSKLR